jgi:hypothetical protein
MAKDASAQKALAQGSVVQPGNAQGDLSLTIYNNDLALVQDIRSLTLPNGHVSLDLPDVSARIRPETVTIAAANTSVIEQNFDYDLLSPQRLLDKSVGQDVSLVRTNPATGAETSEQARVLANNGGTLVQIGNRIEVLGQGNTRLVFPGLPEGLKAHPTLSVTLDSAASGTRPLTLSYLSQGFGWKADYVALFDEASGKIDVQGWVTLTNSTGTAFPMRACCWWRAMSAAARVRRRCVRSVRAAGWSRRGRKALIASNWAITMSIPSMAVPRWRAFSRSRSAFWM